MYPSYRNEFGLWILYRLVKGEKLMAELGLGPPCEKFFLGSYVKKCIISSNMGNILLEVDCIAYMQYDP